MTCRLHVELFSMSAYAGRLDKKLLVEIMGKVNYEGLVREGMMNSMDDEDESQQ